MKTVPLSMLTLVLPHGCLCIACRHRVVVLAAASVVRHVCLGILWTLMSSGCGERHHTACQLSSNTTGTNGLPAQQARLTAPPGAVTLATNDTIQRAVATFVAGMQAFAARDGGGATTTAAQTFADVPDDLLLKLAMESTDYHLRALALSTLVVRTTNEDMRTEALFELAELCRDVGDWETQRRFLEVMCLRCEAGHGRRFHALALLALGRHAWQRGEQHEAFRLKQAAADLYLGEGQADAACNVWHELAMTALVVDPACAEAAARRMAAHATTPQMRARAEQLAKQARAEQEPATRAFRRLIQQAECGSSAEEMVKRADEFLRTYPSSSHTAAVTKLRAAVLNKQSERPQPAP